MTRLMRIPQAGVSSIVNLIGRLCSQVRPVPQRLQVPWFAGHNEMLPLVLVVALHVCVWWIVALLFHAPSDIHNDMAEAFSWGRELQWGYYKHPPFWAWIARCWFSIFPATDWAFYLLSVINSAVGLVGVWAIAGRYVTGARRLAAVVLLELVPFYHLLAFTYNANSIELSVWPWTIYAFIVSFETRRLVPAVSFGALAAAAMLSKYFGGVLLVSCLVAAIASPLARAYFRSAAPYVTILVFGACVAPHLAWLLEASSGPVDYLSTKTEYPFLFVAGKAATVVAGIILQHGFLIVVLVALRRKLGEPAWGLASASPRALIGRPKIRLLVALAVAPVLVTVLVSLMGNVRLSTKFALPLFSLMPLVWIIFNRAKCGLRSMCAVGLCIGLVMGGALLVALPAADLKFKHNHRHFAEPRAIVARQLTELWHAQMAAPLRIVAGTESYALATTFYSADHPSHFIDFSTTRAPWIDDARLSRDGLAIICVFDDKTCLGETGRFQSLKTTRLTLSNVSKTFLGNRGKAFSFVVLLVHPGQTVHAPAIDCCSARRERNGSGAGNSSAKDITGS